MIRPFSRATIVIAAVACASPLAFAAGDGPAIERSKWSFGGLMGQFDEAQLQRGFLVYREACLACHGLKRVYFRNLTQAGGPKFSEDGVKGLAASWPNQIHDGPNDSGDIADRKGNLIKRPAKLSDPILGPYDNDNQARAAQNGALPPDLSLIARARNVEYHGPWWLHPFAMLKDVVNAYQEGGTVYTYALLTGYSDKPPAYSADASGRLVGVADKDVRDEKSVQRCASITHGEGGAPDTCNKLQDGMYYNRAFPGGQIAMPPPISSPVKYQANAGAESTVEQNARDLSAFLAWTADPKLDERKRIGWQVLLYMLITAILLYISKKRIWSRAH